MDLNALAGLVAGKSPDVGTRSPNLRLGVSAGVNGADRAGTIRVVLDGVTVPGVATLGGEFPVGTPVWLLETGGMLLALGASGGGSGGPRNRIINGDFSVNQRAFTSTTTTNTYGFDRWQHYTNGGTVTFSAQTPALGELPESARAFLRVVTSGQASASDYAHIGQPIESVRTLSGKTATVSFWARAASGTPKVAVEFQQIFGSGGSPSSTVFTYAGQVTLSTSWTRYSVTVAVPSITGKTLGTDADRLLAVVWASGGSDFNARTGSLGLQNVTVDFWGVQVEAGSAASPYEQKSYVDELRACQRYYFRIGGEGAATYARLSSPGAASLSTMAYPVAWFPVPMRTRPTSMGANGSHGLDHSGAIVAVTGLAVSNSTKFNATIAASTTGGLTASSIPYVLACNNDANAWIDFSAEL
jgi:hypothetical protein